MTASRTAPPTETWDLCDLPWSRKILVPALAAIVAITHMRLAQALLALQRDDNARLPIDPCSGKPLLLIRTDRARIVYSVGLDSRDDGGDCTDGKDILMHWNIRLAT